MRLRITDGLGNEGGNRMGVWGPVLDPQAHIVTRVTDALTSREGAAGIQARGEPRRRGRWSRETPPAIPSA